jgi:preprotein translocase subunit SecD
MMDISLYPAPPPSTRRHPARYALAFLTVLAAAALIILLISPDKPAGSVIDRQGGTRVTLTARAFDGSSPTPDALSQAQRVIVSRVTGLGFAHAQVDATDDAVTVTVPGNRPEQIRSLGQTGRLHIRPVIHSLAASSKRKALPGRGSAPPVQPDNPQDFARRIADEKKLRQSTSVGIQLLDLQFQATRCDQPDILADNDDPDLPLVTCSADHKVAYVLAPSIISGDQIQDASSSFDQQAGRYVVKLQFTGAATRTWAKYSAAHLGTETAFTVDSRVVSAPQVRGAIPDGKAQIAGMGTAFTADGARGLANVLKYGSLPLSFNAPEPEIIAPKAVSAAQGRQRFTTWPVITTAVLLAALLCVQAYLWLRRDGRKPGAAPPAVSGWHSMH